MSEIPTTTIYGLPHEKGGSLPGRTLTGGPAGEDPILAEAVEAELERIEDDVASTLAAMLPAAVTDFQPGQFTVTTTGGNWLPSGASTGVDSGTYVDCAVVFTAPTSGRAKLTYDAMYSVDGGTRSIRIEPEVRQGPTVGSGSVVDSPAGTAGADFIGTVGNISDGNQMRSGAHKFLTGLTPGQVYNARLLHRLSSTGVAVIERRRLTAEPVS